MPPRRPRADAIRNRQRVLDAAALEFRESGIDVPMSEVARRAGVGIATLVRNFPAREDLIAAVFGPSMKSYADAVSAAATDPDPWRGFSDFIRYVCRIPQQDRGFAQVLTTMFPGVAVVEAERQRGLREFVRLVRRAKACGALRADFSPHDLPLIMLATAGVTQPGSPALGTAADRLVGYLLQSFAAVGSDPVPGLPPAKALYAALERS